MQLESKKLLEDIRVASIDALNMAADRTFEQFAGDKPFRYAVERCFEIAGEALSKLNKIDPSTARSITDWQAIIGFRNVLIHGYGIVNHAKTWDILTNELPLLLKEVTMLLSQ